ncbi:MAG: ribosomal L7Ae/L30e/S12e/Gadd45 family protein [Anaerovoracaceae bacterium]|nr:ribosomal L7Ae/L30e/S12e/Gadd45 family protein [Anaerovoracaceae bacterium]
MNSKRSKIKPDPELMTNEERAAFYSKKVLSYMGLCAKAGKLRSGTNTCLIEMEKKSVKLLIVAGDMAENSAEKLLRKAEKLGVKNIRYGESDALAKATGRYGAGVFGITDNEFADTVAKAIDNTRSTGGAFDDREEHQ